MAKGEIQFIADFLLLEKIAIIESGITKNAGLVDSIKSSLGFIVDEVKGRVEREGIMGTLITYLSVNYARRWWPGMVAIMIADSFGFSAGSFFKKILDSLKGPIENNEQISLSDINSIGKRVVEEEAGPMETTSSNDFLYDLRKIEKEGKLIRYAAPGGVLARILGSLSPRRGKWAIGGILLLFVKAVLWGAGLLTVSAAASKVVGIDRDKGDKSEEDKDKPGSGFFVSKEEGSAPIRSVQVPALSWAPPKVSHSLPTSGQGQTYFENNGVTSIWQVPLHNSLPETMTMWAQAVYPDLKGAEQVIMADPAFNIMVSNLSKYVEGNVLLVPPNFHSIKGIVDHFVGQVARKLLKEKTNEAA